MHRARLYAALVLAYRTRRWHAAPHDGSAHVTTAAMAVARRGIGHDSRHASSTSCLEDAAAMLADSLPDASAAKLVDGDEYEALLAELQSETAAEEEDEGAEAMTRSAARPEEEEQEEDGEKERGTWRAGDDEDAAMTERPVVNEPEVRLPALWVPSRNDPHVSSNGGSGSSSSSQFGSADEGAAATEGTTSVEFRMADETSYITQQDALYLSYPTPPEGRLPSPSALATRAPQERRRCVLAVFAANDLRVEDNYVLALAAMRARTAGGLPVVAVCVLDYRTFAQPSAIGGFYRQGPQRARYLLDTVAALRAELEAAPLHVPLLIRCGRPEEHIPRLAVELGAVDVFLTTQYSPHERRVHDAIVRRLRQRIWPSRQQRTRPGHCKDDHGDVDEAIGQDGAMTSAVVEVVEHTQGHPYCTSAAVPPPPLSAVVHSVWQTTLVHLDDLPTPVAAMKEGERWYHDDVTVSSIRPTAPYNHSIRQLGSLPPWHELLPTAEERAGRAAVPFCRGRLPSLAELGYGELETAAFQCGTVIATQSAHPAAGTKAAQAQLQDWLAQGGMLSMLRWGRPRRTNTKMYSPKLSRMSPYLAVGALSPRSFYEAVRLHAGDALRDGFVQMQYREFLLRLARRDYWHWMGLRYGDRLFFPFGPHPETSDALPGWRHDRAIVQKWCLGLTGIPFADAAMRELGATGFVAHPGRQALAWLFTRGYGQDWRLGAEWFERNSLDYDCCVCYGNFAYFSALTPDDFGEPVFGVHYLAHHHDQTGIYVKKWLPQLSRLPPVYVHRPHILTPRMQALHHVYLGKNYPYPMKLWAGAQDTLSAAQLPAYVGQRPLRGPGYAEAVRHGTALLDPGEWAITSPAYVLASRAAAATSLPMSRNAATSEGAQTWMQAYLPETSFVSENEDDDKEEVMVKPSPSSSSRQGTTQAAKAV